MLMYALLCCTYVRLFLPALGSVDMDEFKFGCLKVQGMAKSFEIAILMHEVMPRWEEVANKHIARSETKFYCRRIATTGARHGLLHDMMGVSCPCLCLCAASWYNNVSAFD